MDLNSLRDCVILYVEDDIAVQNQTKMILSDFVKEVLVASSGAEGLAVLREKKVDLIITDITMPELNGIEMLKTLRYEDKNMTPVIITTAFTETDYLLDAVKLRVEGFIMKPINIKELVTSMYNIVLPIMQKKELEDCSSIVESLSVLVGGKKIEILKYIMNNLDDDHIFNGSYQDIMDNIGVSKPTVVGMFKQLIKAGILEKLKNKMYKFTNKRLISKIN
ncbi:response regulator [Sulfurospirillum sp. 1612]|uniref:response regulator n=1 Tax=Sulfurospirillum sp. 1612 TaxID=3094835 RepID=UPI002F93BAF1